MSFAGIDPTDPGTESGFDYSDIGAGDRSAQAKLPLMESVEDTASNAFFGMERGIINTMDLSGEAYRARMDKQFNVDPTADPGGALIDPKEWQAKYPDLGLTFSPDMGTAEAQLLVNHKQDELRRQYVLDHSPDTMMAKTARGLTDLAVSAVDPLNIAAAFVPGVGEARAALWASKLGKFGGRLAEGAAAGAMGTAALQPLQAIEANAWQDHYGPMDAFLNVAFGSALGGGLHAGVGLLSDLMGRASPETREAALRGAVAQAAEGRPVDVEPILGADPAFHTVTEPTNLTSLPVINHEDFALAGRESQMRDEVAGLDQQLAALPEGDAGAQDRLARLQAVEDQLKAPDLAADLRKTLATRRDELLANTNPEALQAAAQPIEARRTLQAQRENSARALADIQSQRRAIAAQDALTSRMPGLIQQARQKSLDFAQGREPSAITMPEEESRAAGNAIMSKAGDDIEAHLADAEERLKGMREQGLVSDEEHAAFNDANKADEETVKTRTLAARRAAACLSNA